MHAALTQHQRGERTFTIVFRTGEEVVAGLQRFARENAVESAQVTAIGAFRDAILGYWDWPSKRYLDTFVDEQVEVASLQGNISMGPDGAPVAHLHAVLGRRDCTAFAGHLREAHVRPTLEVFVTEVPGRLQRQRDENTGLALLREP